MTIALSAVIVAANVAFSVRAWRQERAGGARVASSAAHGRSPSRTATRRRPIIGESLIRTATSGTLADRVDGGLSVTA
jgi:hypothetical protein